MQKLINVLYNLHLVCNELNDLLTKLKEGKIIIKDAVKKDEKKVCHICGCNMDEHGWVDGYRCPEGFKK